MREVVTAVAPDLKDAVVSEAPAFVQSDDRAGSRASCRFQMEAYRVPPGSPVPPGLVDGSFAVNLGVYVEALVEQPNEARAGQWVSEYHCQVGDGQGEF